MFSYWMFLKMNDETQLSLENLVEGEDLGLEVMHPGGVEITVELAELTGLKRGAKVLDVACGRGESAFYLSERFGWHVMGIDILWSSIKRARKKAIESDIDAEFAVGDAQNLPFEDRSFDGVISECALCLMDKERALREMVRVVRNGGWVGMHDLCWERNPPEEFKHHLARVEKEKPETIEGWKKLFESAGLVDVIALDRSHLIGEWIEDLRRKVGITGQIRLFLRIMRMGGISGYRIIRKSEKIFESGYVGYCIVVGKKP